MAYTLTFYCTCGEGAASDTMGQLIQEAQEEALFVASESSGDGWASAHLGSTRTAAITGDTTAELHVRSLIARDSIAQIAPEDIAGLTQNSDSILTLTFSGDGLDLPVTRAVWNLATRLWNAVPYDEIEGFQITESAIR